jgi:hypothetical protein
MRTRDVRHEVLDLNAATPDQMERLTGRRCARCGSTSGLTDADHAYTTSATAGRLGWLVKLCDHCTRG